MRHTKPLGALLLVGFLYAPPLLHIPLLDSDEADFASILFYPVGIYVLLAIGLYVAVGQAGLLNLGHAAFFAVGAYTMGILNARLGLNYFEVLPCASSWPAMRKAQIQLT